MRFARALVAAVLLTPALAAAEFTATPPAGWTRDSPARERQLIDNARKKYDTKGIELEVESYSKPGGSADTGFLATLMTSRPNKGSLQQVVDAIATDSTNAMKRIGLKRRSAATPKVKGQAVAFRQLEGRGVRMFVDVRAAIDKQGAIEVLQVMCSENAGDDVCKQAMGTVKLKPL